MKILLTKTLFISLFLSAGAPVAITAGDFSTGVDFGDLQTGVNFGDLQYSPVEAFADGLQYSPVKVVEKIPHSGEFASKLVVAAVDEVVNPLKNAKFFIENNAPRVLSYLNEGVKNIGSFSKESPEKAGIYAVATAAGCYLAYKAYHSEKFKPVKERTACLLNGMWDNIKYLSRTLLPMKIATRAFHKVLVKNLKFIEGKNFGDSNSSLPMIFCFKLAEKFIEASIVIDMPLVKLTRNIESLTALMTLYFYWVAGSTINDLNNLEIDLQKIRSV